MELVTIRGISGRHWSFGESSIVADAGAAAATKLFEVVRLSEGNRIALRPPGVNAFLSARGDERALVAGAESAGSGETFVVERDAEGREWLRTTDGTTVGVDAHGRVVAGGAAEPVVFELQTAMVEAMEKQQNCCGTHDHHEEPEQPPDITLEWNDQQHRSVLTTAITHLTQLFNSDRLGAAAKRVYSLATMQEAFTKGIYEGIWKADYADEYTGLFAGKRAYYLHFYDPDTGGHFMPRVPFLAKGNARTCFVEHFTRGAQMIPERSPYDAGFALGLALHYLTDLSQPMHSANFPNLWVDTLPNPLEWRHSNFEEYADNKKIQEAWWEGEYDPSKWGRDPDEVIVKVARGGKRIWDKELKAHVVDKSSGHKFDSAVDPAIVSAVRFGYEATIMALVYFGLIARRA